MRRYHHLIDANLRDYALSALDAGDVEKARTDVMNAYENARRMRTSFEEMSLLVRVLMLEFQSDDTARRTQPLPKPRSSALSQQRQAIQLELFALLTEIQARQRG